MIDKTHSRKSRSSAKTRGKTPLGIVTMFTMKGDAIKALSGFKLPAGAKVAIVSSRPESVREIRKTTLGRVARVTEVIEKEPGQVRADSKPLVDRSAFEPDARSRAMLEGIRIAEEDLRDAGGAYDLDQVRTLMRGVSRQAVDKRVQEGSLLAVPGPSNRRSYPTLQFNRDGTVVPGLKAVREALQTSNPWSVLNFLSHPDVRLDNRRPIDLLKSGNVDIVLDAARRHGEQGA
ncbi:hypothetical protein EDE05_112130 [Neorhizobium sp. R1-B]|uniref:hypothetical protein n=1 Tax=Neorhizobium sp. R1-B TaxID=2485162 RepID=UPI0010CFD59F|nr:hypothetical protein [Neorhizobium sp. R1-B]TDX79666.1 hypothetical protein EDE05_112130 [Neorhizobium sp. R1-B]